ncbi:NAD-dependent epimerase/dehydratase family protein [Humibacter sp. RRB41]|uniref:NAD-dependent epimerase/dehydratase family protein n=1 Tax=Humibacter sp. RRB41 TaxID=2919946 RepID=UPI001FA9F005|nr:NAD-dependent epimerase/dehydratase family protein [Humibacter sp. RRB41]
MHAVILGGTGALGGATAATLAAAGWAVDVTGRDPSGMPAELERAGVRFHRVDRHDIHGIGRLVGADTGLLVDVLAFKGADVHALLPVLSAVGHTVVISGRAVYVDSAGRNINGDEPPRFAVPIREDNPTLPPAGDDVDPFTRDGYAPSKVAVEHAALDSGLPVTVIRPAKVHGRWARNPRTRMFVERMANGESPIELADNGSSIDHLTAASNAAALIESIAVQPGRRILNSADPDTPTAEQIVRSIGERIGWNGELELIDDRTDPQRGHHPWRAAHPIVLDTGAATDLGYLPVGSSLDLLTEEIDWLLEAIAPATDAR